MRPSLRSPALNALLVNSATLLALVGDRGTRACIDSFAASSCKAASKVISPLRTDVSTLTSAIRAPAGVPTR